MGHLKAIAKLLQQKRNEALRKPRKEEVKARMARERRRKVKELFQATYKLEKEKWSRMFTGKTPTGAKFLQLLTATGTQLRLYNFTFTPKVGFLAAWHVTEPYSGLPAPASSVFKWIMTTFCSKRNQGERLALVRSLLPSLLEVIIRSFKPPHMGRLKRGGVIVLRLTCTSRKSPSPKAQWSFETWWEK